MLVAQPLLVSSQGSREGQATVNSQGSREGQAYKQVNLHGRVCVFTEPERKLPPPPQEVMLELGLEEWVGGCQVEGPQGRRLGLGREFGQYAPRLRPGRWQAAE